MRRRSPVGSRRAFALITGGGTAGHVQPALAIGEALVARGHEASSILYVGSRRGMEGRLVPEAGFEVSLLPGRGIQRRLTPANIGAVGGLVAACVLGLATVLRTRPSVVVTVGGYAGLPCSLAAILLRVPLVVVSCDAVAGASNRVVARFARRCAVAFEGTRLPNQVVTGAPLRQAVLATARSPQGREQARQLLGLGPGRFLVAVEGGSLGARRLNDAALGLAKSWASRGEVTIYHVSGERNLAEVRREAAGLGLGPQSSPEAGLDYRLVGYERQMPALLAACDFAVCRAGALTVAELAAIGTPSALVPLPGAPNDHQTRNAEALSGLGAAILIPDADCSAERLEEVVASLIEEPGRLESMSAAAAAAGHRDASEAVAVLVESVSKEGT
ncbi:MAG: UDP-N-acetylglucosamine--N-acetylmuramyl-(pentapeptide) pyrophosphoryl-undecaprenol N-acetylglucosamine transferase [Acidimicrobiales bacterium]|jgi:UDP-N-acetylglucosamine--N-acetylmuramyl-(pentapeptide) pyrophosphoryl-undecaprenol N-acetylglucosamine transferase